MAMNSLSEQLLQELKSGMSEVQIGNKHNLTPFEVRTLLNPIQNYLVISAEDLKAFGIKVGVWSVVGATVMFGYAVWWERGEDERKENRAHKKRDRELKAARRVMEKRDRELKAARRVMEKARKKGTEVFAVRLKQKGTENETTIRVQVPLGTTYKEAYEDLLNGNLNPAFKIVE